MSNKIDMLEIGKEKVIDMFEGVGDTGRPRPFIKSRQILTIFFQILINFPRPYRTFHEQNDEH